MKTIKFLILLLHNAQESRGGFPWNRIFLSAPDDKVWHVGLKLTFIFSRVYYGCFCYKT